MKKCIITGATGYIGSHVLKYLLGKGWDVSIIADPSFGYANIEDVKDEVTIFEYGKDKNIEKLIAFFNEREADVVFHLAAAVITNYTPRDIPVIIQSNIQFGTEILEAMRHSSTRLIVTTGTYWQNYKSDDYNPVDLYAASKEAFEKILQYYVDAHGIRTINLRLYDVYGEDDNRPKLWSHLRDIAGTNEVLNVSPGEQLLEVVHITDVCTAYESAYDLLAGNKNIKNIVCGVCTGKQRTLKDLILLFERMIGKKIHVNFRGKPYKPREVMKPKANYAKLSNWKARVSAEEGFSRYRQ